MPATFAVMATYPARMPYVGRALESIMRQVDSVYLVANLMSKSTARKHIPKGIQVISPRDDLKDTGKFFVDFGDEDEVLLCDDDIEYPQDYVSTLRDRYLMLSSLQPIIGVHGVVYSDFFDGNPSSRLVHVFHRALAEDRFVNQVGTGTVFCRGFQMPPFEFMADSQRFVDLRFAVHCHRNHYPRICVSRPADWLRNLDPADSLFESFTREWPAHCTREAQEIAGTRLLPPQRVLTGSNRGAH